MYISPSGNDTVYVWDTSLQLKITNVVCQVLIVDQARCQKYKHAKAGVVSTFQSPQANGWHRSMIRVLKTTAVRNAQDRPS